VPRYMDMDHTRLGTAMDMDQSQRPIDGRYEPVSRRNGCGQHLATAMDTGQCRVAGAALQTASGDNHAKAMRAEPPGQPHAPPPQR
jgi:hypothetical protein